MAEKCFLIVNADDFGLSPGVNRGIVEAHELGIVTSASLMVRWPCAAEAAVLAATHPRLSIGLHVDLCEWAYKEEAWVAAYTVVPVNDGAAVAQPQHPDEARFLMWMSQPQNLREYHEKTRENIQKLMGWMRAVEEALPVERVRLWSEGEENFEARLDEILAVR